MPGSLQALWLSARSDATGPGRLLGRSPTCPGGRRCLACGGPGRRVAAVCAELGPGDRVGAALCDVDQKARGGDPAVGLWQAVVQEEPRPVLAAGVAAGVTAAPRSGPGVPVSPTSCPVAPAARASLCRVLSPLPCRGPPRHAPHEPPGLRPRTATGSLGTTSPAQRGRARSPLTLQKRLPRDPRRPPAGAVSGPRGSLRLGRSRSSGAEPVTLACLGGHGHGGCPVCSTGRPSLVTAPVTSMWAALTAHPALPQVTSSL